MSQYGPVATRAAWKRFQPDQNTFTEENRQTEDWANLNDDGEHLPKSIGQVRSKQGLSNPKMSGGTNRQEFGYAFNDSQDEGKEVVVQLSPY
jgi:hypothetical protein